MIQINYQLTKYIHTKNTQNYIQYHYSVEEPAKGINRNVISYRYSNSQSKQTLSRYKSIDYPFKKPQFICYYRTFRLTETLL